MERLCQKRFNLNGFVNIEIMFKAVCKDMKCVVFEVLGQ